jgi:amino acid adenylation domain-containing protein
MQEVSLIGKNISARKQAAANQNLKEKEYWLQKLTGEIQKSSFPFKNKKEDASTGIKTNIHSETQQFNLEGEIFTKIKKISNQNDHTLHMILTAALALLISKYLYDPQIDILIGTPIYKQEKEIELINSVLPLRNRIDLNMSFKELLVQVRKNIIEATEHYRYPMEIIIQQLHLTEDEEGDKKGGNPLFDIALLLENIHRKEDLNELRPQILFSFNQRDHRIEGKVHYHKHQYEPEMIETIIQHYRQLLKQALSNPDTLTTDISLMGEEEKHRVMVEFNQTQIEYQLDRPIYQQFEQQAEKTPHTIALMESNTHHMTFQEVNQHSNHLASWILKTGNPPGSIIGVLLERKMGMVITLMAILKSGNAYLPIETEYPVERIQYMLKNSGVTTLLTDTHSMADHSFTALRDFENNSSSGIIQTGLRPHIKEFNSLPMPDRNLINIRNYKNKIGMASVTNCISLQTTRGCPFECLFCHKIWSKKHVHREAEHIYSEIEYYYQKGVLNFAVIDDCFNLNIQNSSQLFRLIIQNKLKLQLFFPNGLRGDMMTPDYIDLMSEAGTRGINLSLESASPRLQKLLKKNLDLDKFRQVVDYIATQHPEIMLEMASMHGFPDETEEEALMTLNFIKDIKWLHFPYIHILKIFPNTEMEEYALKCGISKEDIIKSKDRAFHELPETLPFPKSFTRKYQANFLNEYFLNQERLKKVLPVQMAILSEEALAQKYNAYLPVEIKKLQDILRFAQIDDQEISGQFKPEQKQGYTIFDEEGRIIESQPGAKKILFLDLSQHFSTHQMLYRVVEQPVGLICLLTLLKQEFGHKINGRIWKSGNDFDSYHQLKKMIEIYQPDLIGIRTLTFFKEFFHKTASLIRQWGITAPIMAGGPYASSDYDTILKDHNIELVVLGEGEYTLEEIIREMLKPENNFQIPPKSILQGIKGIVFRDTETDIRKEKEESRQVQLLDHMAGLRMTEGKENPEVKVRGNQLAYVMYTSGSTGKPKGVIVEHQQVHNCIDWMQEKFQLRPGHTIAQRTNLTFDPSVWEIFWPLQTGATVKLLHKHISRDAEYLIELMEKDDRLTMMYCPATLVSAMGYLLNNKAIKPRLKMPWLIIGAEPITRETVEDFYQCYEGKIVNTYGPTEGTINNTWYDLESLGPKPVVPIGRPVANNQIYILSEDLKPMPIKVPGEICIAGHSITRGYINSPEKTIKAYNPNPFGEGKLYRTGDIGRWMEDGTIEILGRKDEQVKIRGYRIETGEIENAINTHPAIKESIVMVKNKKNLKKKIKSCKKCGITNQYPNAAINENNVCQLCEEYNQTKKYLEDYFGNPEDMKKLIQKRSQGRKGAYDCLLLYSGGRGSAYALYQLKEMGFNILALTYDNGYFGRLDLANIKKITQKLGVDHLFLQHPQSDRILGESIRIASTVCRGCFHTSSSLAGEYAYKHDIPVVVGATLSRGQIIENRLFMFLRRGITQKLELEKETLEMQKMTPQIDKSIFDLIDIEEVKEGKIHEKVKFLDFYRYNHITNKDMIQYLDHKDPYWKTRKRIAIYSTNCPIKQIGDYGHLREMEYHYYGAATSWEKRLEHLTLENVKEDLQCRITNKGYQNFIKRIGYKAKSRSKSKMEQGDTFLCAYIVKNTPPQEKDISQEEIRTHLSKHLPNYMIPLHFEKLTHIPLTESGKINKQALPEPQLTRIKEGATYVEPKTNLEKLIAETWKEVLKIEMAGTQDNFFDLGGNSLDIIMVGNQIKEKTGKEVSAVNLFTYPTIGSLAQYLEKEAVTETVTDEEIDQSVDMIEETMQMLMEEEEEDAE